jgi:hypothetical protein
MCNSEIETYREIIKTFEKALKECTGSEDIKYYKQHIEIFKKKIKEFGG